MGKCITAETEFSSQKYAKPVDHHPYRTNPKAPEVIDKCVESMESDDRKKTKRIGITRVYCCIS